MVFPKLAYTSQKRLDQLKRDTGGPKYKQWRDHILLRDDGQCQMGKCTEKTGIQIHHIKTWAKNPHLRHNTYNGICLCAKHHRLIHSKEHLFEQQFLAKAMMNEMKLKKTNDSNS